MADATALEDDVEVVVELEVDVDVDVLVEVDVELDVDVEVDVVVVFVFVGGVVCVEVDVEVDVRIGDRLVAGVSVVGSLVGASVVRDTIGVRDGSVGGEIVREALGRFEPPPHDATRTVKTIGSARNARSRSGRRKPGIQVSLNGVAGSLVNSRPYPSP